MSEGRLHDVVPDSVGREGTADDCAVGSVRLGGKGVCIDLAVAKLEVLVGGRATFRREIKVSLLS